MSQNEFEIKYSVGLLGVEYHAVSGYDAG